MSARLVNEPIHLGTVKFYPPTTAANWPEVIEVPVEASNALLDRLSRIEAKLDRLTRALQASGTGWWTE